MQDARSRRRLIGQERLDIVVSAAAEKLVHLDSIVDGKPEMRELFRPNLSIGLNTVLVTADSDDQREFGLGLLSCPN